MDLEGRDEDVDLKCCVGFAGGGVDKDDEEDCDVGVSEAGDGEGEGAMSAAEPRAGT